MGQLLGQWGWSCEGVKSSMKQLEIFSALTAYSIERDIFPVAIITYVINYFAFYETRYTLGTASQHEIGCFL